MPLDPIKTSIAMMGEVRSGKLPARYIRDTFFARNIYRSTERAIALDRVLEDLRVGRYVRPNLPGKVRSRKKMETMLYEPPYIKEKDELDIRSAFERGPGERFGGERSWQQRLDDAQLALTIEHEARITRAEELQCIDLLLDAALTFKGDGYDDTITFERDGSATGALGGTARWNQAGEPGDAVAHLARWSRQRQAAAYGGVVTQVIMDPLAEEIFDWNLKTSGKTDLLNTNFRLGDSALQVFGGNPMQTGRIKGIINGIVIHVYQDQVENEAGSMVNVLPDNTVIGIGEAAQPMLAYGAIAVHRMGPQPMDRYTRIVGGPDQDPSTEHVLTESAPMALCRRMNATYAYTVR